MFLHDGTRWKFAVGDAARTDAEFNEADHPRAPDGKFDSGGGKFATGKGQAPNYHIAETHPSMRGRHYALSQHGFGMVARVGGPGGGQQYAATRSSPVGPIRHRVNLQPTGEWHHSSKAEDPDNRSGNYPERVIGSGKGQTSLRAHLEKEFGKSTATLTKDVVRADAVFEESDHPRDDDGKFASGGGGGSGTSTKMLAAVKTPEGKHAPAGGGSFPEHIAKLKIPPAWSNVRYADNPASPLLITGKDTKGRPVSVYSAEHHAKQAAAKFARIHELVAKLDAIKQQNEAARKEKATRDVADCLDLIIATGIRPGGEGDTGAEKQAYGATTLQGRHVRVRAGGVVTLEFIGKKGVALSIPVHDKAIAQRLLKRKEQAGSSGRLFGDVTAGKLLAHTHDMDGGGFKTKDFRTALGTTTAAKLVAARKPPTDEKSYKRAVMEVAKEVSAKLGNTPTIALQSYINPVVFASWKLT
jgi:DNA topoisomerase-1